MIDSKILVDLYNEEYARFEVRRPNMNVPAQAYAVMPVYDRGFQDGFRRAKELAEKKAKED
jgi:hypothetical protein